MNRPIVVLWTFLVFWQELVSSEVIVREWNKNEGSICFLEDGSRGICRPSCIGQEPGEYSDNICNPGQTRSLYCCVEKEVASLYPTLDDICFKRMLFQEFLERGEHLLDMEEQKYVSKEDFKEIMETHEKECLKESQNLEEDEKNDFLEHCLQKPNIPRFDEFVQFRLKEREHITAAGLFYRDQHNISLECTGIFIHTSFLLTSASCLTKAAENGRAPNYILATLNETLSIKKFPLYIYSPIERVLINGNFSPENVQDDIAFVQGDSKCNNGKYWIPNIVCLWTKKWIPAHNLSLSLHSYKRNIDIRHPVSCETNLITNTTSCNLCELKNEAELQNELLVGPVQYSDASQPNVPRLIGISSFNPPCSDNKPAPITKIYDHLEEIEAILSEVPFKFCFLP